MLSHGDFCLWFFLFSCYPNEPPREILTSKPPVFQRRRLDFQFAIPKAQIKFKIKIQEERAPQRESFESLSCLWLLISSYHFQFKPVSLITMLFVFANFMCFMIFQCIFVLNFWSWLFMFFSSFQFIKMYWRIVVSVCLIPEKSKENKFELFQHLRAQLAWIVSKGSKLTKWKK